jgi:hypothetical protein
MCKKRIQYDFIILKKQEKNIYMIKKNVPKN